MYQSNKQVEEEFKKKFCRNHHRVKTLVVGHLSNGIVEPWSADAIISDFLSQRAKDLEAICGILKQIGGVTDEEMDKAIKVIQSLKQTNE